MSAELSVDNGLLAFKTFDIRLAGKFCLLAQSLSPAGTNPVCAVAYRRWRLWKAMLLQCAYQEIAMIENVADFEVIARAFPTLAEELQATWSTPKISVLNRRVAGVVSRKQ